MLRLIVASETSTPLSSKKASQCSDKVRSGLDSKCPGNHSLKASPFTEGVPGILRISTSPVRRLLLSQRLIDGGHRDPEELCDLLPRDAVVYCGERLQSKVLGVCVHGPYFRAGPLLTQSAVRVKHRSDGAPCPLWRGGSGSREDPEPL